MQEMQGWENSVEKEMAPHSSNLAWRSHGQWNLEGDGLRDCRKLYAIEHTHGRTCFILFAQCSLGDLPVNTFLLKVLHVSAFR